MQSGRPLRTVAEALVRSAPARTRMQSCERRARGAPSWPPGSSAPPRPDFSLRGQCGRAGLSRRVARSRLMRSCRRGNRFAPRAAATRRSASVAALRSLRHGRRVSSLRAFPGATRRLETWDPASARWARRSMRGSERPSSRHPPGAPPRSGARGRACPASRNTRGRRPSQHCPRETP
jgi:hypothetical protein